MQLFFQLAEHLVFLSLRGAWDTTEARALRGPAHPVEPRRLSVDQYLRGIVREEAVEGYGKNVRPVLRREPLDQAIEKAGVGLARSARRARLQGEAG